MQAFQRVMFISVGSALAALLTACATTSGNAALAIAGFGHTPTSQINQTYYLGVFDPIEQLEPTLYRIRVQGQASALSQTSFASGWVRSDIIDSLSGKASTSSEPSQPESAASGATNSGVKLNLEKSALSRRLVMFGPEGFREAPKDHRLVIVMGSSPAGFFGAMDQALGIVASATQKQQTGGIDVSKEIFPELSRMREERRSMQSLIELSELVK
jgi:hypothetical protein